MITRVRDSPEAMTRSDRSHAPEAWSKVPSPVADTKDTPAGSGSEAVTPVAGPGPLLVTVSV